MGRPEIDFVLSHGADDDADDDDDVLRFFKFILLRAMYLRRGTIYIESGSSLQTLGGERLACEK